MIWSCSATVHLDRTMDVPGYPKSDTITVNAKVRTEGSNEPSSKDIDEEIRNKLSKCYAVGVTGVENCSVDFFI